MNNFINSAKIGSNEDNKSPYPCFDQLRTGMHTKLSLVGRISKSL